MQNLRGASQAEGLLRSRHLATQGYDSKRKIPSLLNSPELRFVCEDVRSGVDEGQNRPGHEVWEGEFDVVI